MPVKAIQLLLNEQLPEDIRDYSRTYDSGSIKELMTEAANKHPDEYAQIVKNIMDVGRNAAYNTGYTVRLKDFKPVLDRKPIFEQLDNEVATIRATVKDKNKREKMIKQLFEKYTVGLEKLTTEAAKKLGTGNNLYNAIQSGARGNNTQFKAIVTTPGLYTDYKGDTIPLFIKHSYADGLSPAELLSSTFGTRKSFITIKKSTAIAGGWGKSLLRPVSTMVVTSDKDLSDNGIDIDTDDDSLYGRVLARDAGNLKKGTVIDRNALNYLKNSKIKSVIVHSPIATISANGVPAQAVGLNIQKKLYSIGEHPGYNAATAISEPVTQAGLCLEESTLVKMADGSDKMIKDIEVGDKVLAYDKASNKVVISTVLNKYDQGIKQCNHYKINGSLHVKSTKDHKFMFNDDEVKVINSNQSDNN